MDRNLEALPALCEREHRKPKPDSSFVELIDSFSLFIALTAGCFEFRHQKNYLLWSVSRQFQQPVGSKAPIPVFQSHHPGRVHFCPVSACRLVFSSPNPFLKRPKKNGRRIIRCAEESFLQLRLQPQGEDHERSVADGFCHSSNRRAGGHKHSE